MVSLRDKFRNSNVGRIAMLVSCIACFANDLWADNSNPKKYKVVTLIRDGEVCRVWFLPDEKTKYAERWKSGRIPGSFVEELGIVVLRGQIRLMDLSIEEVCRSTKLDGLDFSGMGLTDIDLAPLSLAENLHELILSGNRVSDMSLEAIGKLPHLNRLNVNATDVTATGIYGLSRHRSNLEIIADERSWIEVQCGGYRQVNLNSAVAVP